MKKLILNSFVMSLIVIGAALTGISCTNITKQIVPAESSDKATVWLATYDANAAAKAKKARILPIETLASLEKKEELLKDSHGELEYKWTEQLNRMNDKYAIASGDISPKVKAANDLNNKMFGTEGMITMGLTALTMGGAATWLRGLQLKSSFATQLTSTLESKTNELSQKLWSDAEVSQWTISDATAVLVQNGIDATKATELANAIAKQLTTAS